MQWNNPRPDAVIESIDIVCESRRYEVGSAGGIRHHHGHSQGMNVVDAAFCA